MVYEVGDWIEHKGRIYEVRSVLDDEYFCREVDYKNDRVSNLIYGEVAYLSKMECLEKEDLYELYKQMTDSMQKAVRDIMLTVTGREDNG